MRMVSEEVERLQAALAAYPRGHSTNNKGALVVQVLVNDLRYVLSLAESKSSRAKLDAGE